MNPQTLHATLIEIGDDEDGTPRLIFHATREQIRQLETVPLYKQIRLTMEKVNTEETPHVWCEEYLKAKGLWK